MLVLLLVIEFNSGWDRVFARQLSSTRASHCILHEHAQGLGTFFFASAF